MKKNLLYLLLIVFIFAIISRESGCETDNVLPVPEKNDKVVVPIIEPVVIVPELKTNILYDDYEKCKELSKIHNMNMIVIFGADWCVYCNKLKSDLKNISNLDKYIICIIDTEKNKSLAREWKVRNLPTSVAMDTKQKVISQIVGYRKKSYESWINSM